MATIGEDELRERTRSLLAETHPDDPRVDRASFRGTQFDRGLAWLHFPEGLGGMGLDPKAQAIVDDELRRGAKTFYNNSIVNTIGIGMAAPTLLAYGSDEHKRRFLRPIFTGEEIWCQLFSEPGAGSDVASLAARAVRKGDAWIVNGQKVWTTLAHVARFGLLLTRSDPDVPKHDGLTYFVLDMQASGVEVRPLYQITGEAEFNEVFLTDVRIPDAMRIGRVGEGWRVAVATLMNERVSVGASSGAGRTRGPIDVLLKLWHARVHETSPSTSALARDAVMRDRIVRLWIESELLRLTNERARATRKAGTPGAEGAVAKLMMAEVQQRIFDACVDVQGNDGLVFGPGYALRRPRPLSELDRGDRAKHGYLRSRANSIEGGTSEVMRNILGERVLGLPGEPRVDKDRPWSQVPRS